ncbi:hypothetical protein N9N67_07015 [Bacteriovoracaceae bacterium]|nr:hypothetical protein [Bacteriovoracaceae bacterium]
MKILSNGILMTLFSQMKKIFAGNTFSLEEFASLSLEDSFISLSINKDEFKGTLHNRLITINGKSQSSLCIGKVQEIIHAEINGVNVGSCDNQDIVQVNNILDKIILWIREKSIDYVKQGEALTPLNVQMENEAMEWLKVSLLVLKKSFSKIKSDDNLIFESRIFFGVPNNLDHPILRIQCLSLDFLLEFMPNHSLRVRVWNYKDNQKDSTSQEDLKVDLVGLKAPVLEEFIILFNEMRSLILMNP